MRARCSSVFVCAQRLVLLLLALAGPAQPLGAQPQQSVEMTPGTGIKITVSNIYGEVPLRGYLPLRVLIINPTDEEGVWTIRTQTQNGFGYGGSGEENFTTETVGRVPARAEDTFEVLAPVDDNAQSYMRTVAVSINGPGVKNPELMWRSTPGATYPPISATTMIFGLSPALATAKGSILKDYYENPKKFSQACVLPGLDPDSMSTDWRGYIGFDMILYTAADWLNLTAAVRAAVLQWVAAGGDLRLIADQDGGLSLPPRLGDRYGAGSILLFTQAELDQYDFTAFYKTQTTTERFLFNFNYEPPIWLVDKAPPAPVPGGPPVAVTTLLPNSFTSAIPVVKNQYSLVALVIVAFGIMVGPLNLFVFCRGANRSRLLWVTPLLSIGASAMLLLFILLSEGIGGHGVYYRLTQLEPDGKFAVESQVNASLTGVLLSRGFHFADPAWLTIGDTAASGNGPSRGTFSQVGTRYSGDWFSSRQVQTLVAEAVVPTRAAVRLEPAPPGAAGPGAPSLRSEYNGQLEDLFYIDAAGSAWKTALLSNGQVLRLQPSSLAEISSAWTSTAMNAPAQLREKLRKLTPQPGTFFALGDDPDAPLQPNLSGFSWTSFHHLVTGPVAQ